MCVVWSVGGANDRILFGDYFAICILITRTSKNQKSVTEVEVKESDCEEDGANLNDFDILLHIR